MEVQYQQKNPLFSNPNQVRLPSADLYRGDCLAVIPGLDGTFDAVVTDPPYSSGGQSKGNRAASTGAKYLNTGSTQWPARVPRGLKGPAQLLALVGPLDGPLLREAESGRIDGRIQRLAAVAGHV